MTTHSAARPGSARLWTWAAAAGLAVAALPTPGLGQQVAIEPGPKRSPTGSQGFGLNYHLGHGYGGSFRGVGPCGGYPFYGGPGYPHPLPCTDRGCRIKPVTYFGGPGYPTPDHPNFFGPTGPLVSEPPVVTFADDPSGVGQAGYGCFHGAIPYDESAFSPSPAIPIEARTSIGTPARPGLPDPAPTPDPDSTTPLPTPTPPPPSPSASATPMATPGVDVQPLGPKGRAGGLRVERVHPGSPAERAGLRPGDVIRSANGYGTDQPGHLSWVVQQAAADRVLRMSVQAAGPAGGESRVVQARLR